MHRFLLHNGNIHKATDKLLSPGQVGLVNGWGVFSTIRVFDGVLFAWERHWVRMQRDAALMRIPFPAEPSEIENPLLELIHANNALNSTLRVLVVRNKGGMWEGPDLQRDYDMIAFTTESKKWGDSVKLGVVPNARHAASPFAGTKILSWSANLTWLEQAHNQGLDEVILLNEYGQVSECTSANVFISQGKQILTPPLSSGCLPGVTRDLLLTEIQVPDITISEQPLELKDLEAADEVFVTSTTRGLLPVSSVTAIKVHSHGLALKPVRDTFTNYVADYVNKRKHKQEDISTVTAKLD